MYVILKPATEKEKGKLCFVQAVTAEKAHEMTNIAEDITNWNVVPNNLLDGFVNIKEGYFVVDL